MSTANATETTPLKTVCLVYDIPVTTNFPNPSPRLHRVGFRLNLSCWVIPAVQLPQDLLSEFSQAGINYHIIEFAAHEEAKIRKMAVDAVNAYAVEIHTSLIKSLDNAAKAFNDARTAVEAECDSEMVIHLMLAPEERRRRNRIKAALKAAADRLEAAISCAEKYDETMNLDDCLKGLKEAIKARRLSHELTLTAMIGV